MNIARRPLPRLATATTTRFHVVGARDRAQPARFAWHKESSLGDADAVILPGGFSYGDYLRAGAMAAHSPIMGAVKRFAEQGGPVLAICNGFQIACEAGLLDGALTRNASLHFECRDVHLLVEGKPTPWTRAIPAGRMLRMPIAHAEGRYVHPERRRARDARGASCSATSIATGGAVRRRQPQRLGRATSPASATRAATWSA